MLSSTMALMRWRKKCESNTGYISSGTSRWVRITPVKLHWSLTRLIRTYTIIYILHCSTKPLVFQSRLNVEVQVNFSPQFYVHINGKLFLHAFMQLCLVRLWLLCGGEKTGESKSFFYNSCGTLIWVRIITVKVDRSLIGIIRTYKIFHILYCSTKPLVFFQSL